MNTQLRGAIALLVSMTGYGEARRRSGPLAVTVEIRTVNNRYLKINGRCSEPYGSLESQIESLIRQHVQRGTVQFHLRVDRHATADDFRLNTDVLSGYRAQLEELLKSWKITAQAPIDGLISLPGVVEDHSAERGDVAEDWPLVESVFTEALQGVVKMRRDEGTALANDLKQQLVNVATQLAQIEVRIPRVIELYRERLTERINKALEKHDVRVSPGDLVREVGLMVDRSDVSEELVRLRSHIDQFNKIMREGEGAGRRLDFLSQEMFREANTIGSKSADVEIAQLVVELKAIIERMREQVQNIE